MKTNLSSNLGLSLLMAFSLAACQKNQNSSEPAAALQPPLETTQDSPVPSEKTTTREEVLLSLQQQGLRFTPMGSGEEYVEAKWDVLFYKRFWSHAEFKPDLEKQLEALKSFVLVMEPVIQAKSEVIDPENEPTAEETLQHYKMGYFNSQVALAKKRIAKLERILSARAQPPTGDAPGAPDLGKDEKDLQPSQPSLGEEAV